MERLQECPGVLIRMPERLNEQITSLGKPGEVLFFTIFATILIEYEEIPIGSEGLCQPYG